MNKSMLYENHSIVISSKYFGLGGYMENLKYEERTEIMIKGI